MLIITDQAIYYDIADAIRECLETDATYLPAEMPDEIRKIPRVAHILAKPQMHSTSLEEVEELIDIDGIAPCRGTAIRQIAISELTDFTFTLSPTARKV